MLKKLLFLPVILLSTLVLTPPADAQDPGDVHQFIASHYGKSNADRYTELIKRKALEYGIPVGVLAALVGRESGYDARCSSGSYPPCVGLMQIKTYPERVAAMHGQPYSPEYNLDWGCHYLKGLYYTTGRDWDRALTAYNRGPYWVVSRGMSRSHYSQSILHDASKIRPPTPQPTKGPNPWRPPTGPSPASPEPGTRSKVSPSPSTP